MQEKALGSYSDEGPKRVSGEHEKLVQILEKQVEETKEQLNNKNNTLVKYEKDLNEKNDEMKEVRVQSEQQVKHIEGKLEKETQLTVELRALLMKKDDEIHESATNVQHLKDQLDHNTKELNNTEVNLREKSEKLNELERDDTSGQVSNLSETVKKLENILEEREMKITQLNILTGKLEERVDSLSNDNKNVHENMEKIKNDLNEQLSNAQNELQNTCEKHETELSEKDLKIKEQEEYLEGKDQTIGLLNNEMAAERSELVGKLEESIKEKSEMEDDLQRYKEDMNSKDNESVSLIKQVKELEERMEGMSEMNREMEKMMTVSS